jgi:hypothetical protein
MKVVYLLSYTPDDVARWLDCVRQRQLCDIRETWLCREVRVEKGRVHMVDCVQADKTTTLTQAKHMGYTALVDVL